MLLFLRIALNIYCFNNLLHYSSSKGILRIERFYQKVEHNITSSQCNLYLFHACLFITGTACTEEAELVLPHCKAIFIICRALEQQHHFHACTKNLKKDTQILMSYRKGLCSFKIQSTSFLIISEAITFQLSVLCNVS